MKSLRLLYDKPARLTPVYDSVKRQEAQYACVNASYLDRWYNAIPLGNGYFGVTVDGDVGEEWVQFTDPTLFSYIENGQNGENRLRFGSYVDGLENFSDTYIRYYSDVAFACPLTNEGAVSYQRTLSLEEGVCTTDFLYDGVRYHREYFTSYPARMFAMRLTCSEKGKLNFAFYPTIPFIRDGSRDVTNRDLFHDETTDNADGVIYPAGHGSRKIGRVSAFADGRIEIDGESPTAGVRFAARAVVLPEGGELSVSPDASAVCVRGADSAVIYMTVGTNYVLTSNVFMAHGCDKTADFDADFAAKLEARRAAAIALGYEAVKASHIADYAALFGRVSVSFGEGISDGLTTDALLAKKRAGTATADEDGYLFALTYQIGRYFMISSSRATLP